MLSIIVRIPILNSQCIYFVHSKMIRNAHRLLNSMAVPTGGEGGRRPGEGASRGSRAQGAIKVRGGLSLTLPTPSSWGEGNISGQLIVEVSRCAPQRRERANSASFRIRNGVSYSPDSVETSFFYAGGILRWQRKNRIRRAPIKRFAGAPASWPVALRVLA